VKTGLKSAIMVCLCKLGLDLSSFVLRNLVKLYYSIPRVLKFKGEVGKVGSWRGKIRWPRTSPTQF
jgi:hypothetical protein